MAFRRGLGLLGLLSGAAAAQEPVPADADAERRLRLDAINLLQGTDSAPFLDTARVRLVIRALGAIRAQLPQVADIPTGPDASFLVLHAADSAGAALVTRSDARRPAGADSALWSATITRVGIRPIDSLNRVFGVSRAEASYLHGLSQLTLEFARPVNVPVVAEAYARVPQVGYAGSELYGGDGSWIDLLPKGRRLLFVFGRGGGDCPAGCTEWDYHYVAYDTVTHSAVLEHQLLHGTRWSEPIAHWDVPTRYSIDAYPTVDSLYAGLRDERWWHRQHAVHVLGMLLGASTAPWGGAAEQSPAHFTALKQAALARRRESYGALVDRVGDPDPDVARLAHVYLRELTGHTFPGGADGAPRWRQWLRESP